MKRLFLTSLVLGIVLAGSAQIRLGLFGGLNLANFSASYQSSDITYNIKPGFHAGGLVSIPLFNKFSLQPEIMYSGMGTHYKEADGDTSNFNLGYINFPVLLKFTTSFGLFAELGPQFGVLISAKEKYKDAYENRPETNIKADYKSTDISAVFGVGYLSPLNLGIDARYNLGMANILKNNAVYSIKNNVIQIGVFYLFDAKKH